MTVATYVSCKHTYGFMRLRDRCDGDNRSMCVCVWESWGEDRGHGWVKTCWIKGIWGHLENVGHVVLSCYCPQYVTHSQTCRKPNTYVISLRMMFRLTLGTQTTFKSSILKLLQNVITNKQHSFIKTYKTAINC